MTRSRSSSGLVAAQLVSRLPWSQRFWPQRSPRAVPRRAGEATGQDGRQGKETTRERRESGAKRRFRSARRFIAGDRQSPMSSWMSRPD
eukprot:2742794-Pleurochrysis_carterae.AAC.2